MSSEEYTLREEMMNIINQVESKLLEAKRLTSTDYVNPQDFTRDELIALKQVLLESYTIVSTTMGVVKRLNANSKAQSSSVKLIPVSS